MNDLLPYIYGIVEKAAQEGANLQELSAQMQKFIEDRDMRIATKIKEEIANEVQDSGVILRLFEQVNEEIISEEH